jgi:hypothetical protein
LWTVHTQKNVSIEEDKENQKKERKDSKEHEPYQEFQKYSVSKITTYIIKKLRSRS